MIFGHSVVGFRYCSQGRAAGAVGLLDGLDLNVMLGAALGLAAPWQVKPTAVRNERATGGAARGEGVRRF